MSSYILVLGAAVVGIVAGFVVQKFSVGKKPSVASKPVPATPNKPVASVTPAQVDARLVRIEKTEARLIQREEQIEQKLHRLDDRETQLEAQKQAIEKAKQELAAVKEQQLAKLEKIAGLSRDRATEVLTETMEKRMHDRLESRKEKLERIEKEELDSRAARLVTDAIQRVAVQHTSETTASSVTLPSEDMKGRIIGKEGRNIKALEKLTGVDFIMDETPETIVISSFNPIRRHVAKRALERLMEDGRIQPSKIEESVLYAKQNIAKEINDAGRDAMYKLGITGFDPKIVQLVGRLKFRTSFGQNVLYHSMEVAQLSQIMAEELGLDGIAAKKGGILHDMGKALDAEVQGTHARLGAEIARKFKVDPKVVNCIEAHHEEVPYLYTEAILTHVCDAISASRPGARHMQQDTHIQRLEELELIAGAHAGVEKVYAIQAGREVRVFVEPMKIDDAGAVRLARDIADEIQEKLNFPGEIRVNVIRETRAVEYAR